MVKDRTVNYNARSILSTYVLASLKFAAAVTAAIALFVAAPLISHALPAKIWDTVDESVITRGVTLEQINRFTVDGWLGIDVVRVDLTDKNISLDALYNGAALKDLTTVKTLAERQGAVAAINGGFFEWNSGWGGTAIGTAMKDGVIDTAFSETNAFGEVMGSITVNALNEVLITYCKPTIALQAAGSAELYAGSYNKKSFYDYRDISILDRKWVKNSVGATKSMQDIVELVAEGGLIREIRVGMPSVVIPVDGFVAVTRLKEDGGHAFSGPGFTVGSPVEFRVTLNPAINDAVMHIEGSSILVRNGVIPDTFSYEPGSLSQRNPRTMVGCSEDGEELLLVTVGGRLATSIGLTSYESAELMYELGAYNALNLDGGGSTTMVARPAGEFELEHISSLSDGSARAVANGIGVFTSAPKAAIKGLIIEALDTNVFVGTHRQFTVKAYDRFYNPVKISDDDVVWSISGFRGQIQNGLLVPETSGAGGVRAKVGRATATFDINVLPSPTELILNSTSLDIRPGQTHTFTVIGRDRMGYSARINPADITWTASDSFGKINKGVFTRGSAISGYIEAAYGNAVAYCAVQPVPAQSGDKADSSGQSQKVKLPPATRLTDKANRAVGYDPSAAGSFRFGVLGNNVQAARSSGSAAGSADFSDPVYQTHTAFYNVVNKSLNAGVFVGSGPQPGVSSGSAVTPAYSTNSDFVVYGNFCGDPLITLIQLSSAGNGLRAAGRSQWGNFLKAIQAFNGSDLFIMLQQSPSTFSDKQEAALFKRILADTAREAGINIWVFYGGSTDSVWIEDGVRYFCCAGLQSAAADRATGAGVKYLEVTVQDGEVTYEYKQLT